MGDYAVAIMKYLFKKAFLVEDNFDFDVLSLIREAVFSCGYCDIGNKEKGNKQ